jgi:hypothetical protein
LIGHQNNEELKFYLKKDNAVEEAAPSYAIGEMGPVWWGHNLTISSSV